MAAAISSGFTAAEYRCSIFRHHRHRIPLQHHPASPPQNKYSGDAGSRYRSFHLFFVFFVKLSDFDISLIVYIVFDLACLSSRFFLIDPNRDQDLRQKLVP